MATTVFGGSHGGSVRGWWSLWCGMGGGFVGGEFVVVVNLWC